MKTKGVPELCNEIRFLEKEAKERIERYKVEYPSHLRRRIKISTHTYKTLWIQQEGCCGICGNELGSDCEVDHIIAFNNGGWTEMDNLQLTHSSCNRKKGDYNTLDEVLDYILKKLSP